MKGIAFYGEDFFTVKQDYDLYAEEIKRLLMTNPGERPGQPYFGAGLRDMVFELADSTTTDFAKNRIQEQISAYLPMLTLTKINVELDNNSFYITLGFTEKGDLPEDERLLTLEFDLEEESGVSE